MVETVETVLGYRNLSCTREGKRIFFVIGTDLRPSLAVVMHFLTLGKTLLIRPFLAGWLLSRARIDPALTARVKLVPQRRVVVKHFHLEQVLQFPK